MGANEGFGLSDWAIETGLVGLEGLTREAEGQEMWHMGLVPAYDSRAPARLHIHKRI
jgi:hypothetical protein